MVQFFLGLFLIAVAAIMAFYGQQVARDGWGKMYPASTAAPINTKNDSISTVNQVGVTAGTINGNITINKNTIVNQPDEKAIHEATVASERAWVTVDTASIRSDLIRKPNGIEIGLNIAVKNNGKSPAKNVFVYFELVSLKTLAGDPFIEVRKRVFDSGSAMTSANMGLSLLSTSKEEVIPFITTMSTNDIESAKKFLKTPSGMLPSLYIVGSVFYQLAFDEKIHHTDFKYYLTAIGDPHYPHGSDLPDFTNTFPSSRIFLDPNPMFNGTFD